MRRSRPVTRSEARERNRQALLEATASAVLERGFEKAALSEIAARAGLTKGAIYSIFGSKRELLLDVVRSSSGGVLADIDGSIDPAKPLADRLRRHALALERLGGSDEFRRVLQLEVELAGLAMRDATILAAVANEREQRVQRLAGPLGGAAVARALIALEQGWATAVAFGALGGRDELARAAAALAQLEDAG